MSEVNFHNVEQRSPEWLGLKVGKITGTRLKNVFKGNNLTLIDELISEKLTGQMEEVFVTEKMQRGVDMEPLGFAAYTEKTGEKVHEIGFVTNDMWPECGLSPDGFVSSNGAIELKCPSSKKHIEYIRTNKVPAEYKYQIFMYFILCDDLDYVDFVSFDPRVEIKPLHILRVKRKDVDLSETKSELRKFCKKLSKYHDQITF